MPIDGYAFATVSSVSDDYGYGANCLICGESIPVRTIRDIPKICDECREAVLYIKNKLTEKEKQK